MYYTDKIEDFIQRIEADMVARETRIEELSGLLNENGWNFDFAVERKTQQTLNQQDAEGLAWIRDRINTRL